MSISKYVWQNGSYGSNLSYSQHLSTLSSSVLLALCFSTFHAILPLIILTWSGKAFDFTIPWFHRMKYCMQNLCAETKYEMLKQSYGDAL